MSRYFLCSRWNIHRVEGSFLSISKRESSRDATRIGAFLGKDVNECRNRTTWRPFAIQRKRDGNVGWFFRRSVQGIANDSVPYEGDDSSSLASSKSNRKHSSTEGKRFGSIHGVHNPWNEEDINFWKDVMTSVSRPLALQMISRLKLDDPMGVDTNLRGASGGKGTVYDFATGVRLQHRRKVVLIRVGDFYEALGFDAVLLVEHAGLNPMGQNGVPRAGCPHQNLRQTLKELTAAGYATVVCEELPEPPSLTRRAKRKQRFISGIVNQASPEYYYRGTTQHNRDARASTWDSDASTLLNEDADSNFLYGSSMELPTELPVVGLSASLRGLCVSCVDVDLRQVRIMEGLTEEAAVAMIQAGGFAPPLYLHESLYQRTMMPRAFGAKVVNQRTFVGPLAEACQDIRHTVRFDGPVPHTQLVQLVVQDLGLPREPPFRSIHTNVFEGISMSSGDASLPDEQVDFCKRDALADNCEEKVLKSPMPINLHTARQIGVLPFPGIPPLMEALLPNSAPASCHQWMKESLLRPPTLVARDATRRACQALADSFQPLPMFQSLTRAGKAVKLITTYQADHHLFRDLLDTMSDVKDFLEGCHPPNLASDILVLVGAETGIHLDHRELGQQCNEIVGMISDVIPSSAPMTGDAIDHLNRPKIRNIIEQNAGSDGVSNDTCDEFLSCLQSFFEQVEGHCWGKIKEKHVLKYREVVELAAAEFTEAVFEDFLPFLQNISISGKSKRPAIMHDSLNKAVWIKMPRSMTAKFQASAEHISNAIDKSGQRTMDKFTSVKVEEARHKYFMAVHHLNQEMEVVIRDLSHQVASRHLASTIAACFFANIARALILHVSHALRNGWVMAELPSSPAGMEISGMWPYWMKKISSSTVSNDLSMTGMALLTGPNMAGKSTIIRTTGSVCLLANCGFMVPAKKAIIPGFSSFFVRMMCTDSPLEGQSAFAVEMLDINSILKTANEASLVLVDELGRGTEPKMGASLCGSVLEALVSIGCKGIFATHLHSILDLQLHTDGVDYLAMETKLENGRKAATWKLVPGINRESLALETALDCGLDVEVIHRAHDLFRTLDSEASQQNPFESELPKHFGNEKTQSIPVAVAQDIAHLFKKEVKHILRNHHDTDHEDMVAFVHVRPGQSPPPRVSAMQSCVYMMYSPGDSWLYCGESDGMGQRIRDHRRSRGEVGFYVVCIPGGKSLARLIEAELICSLKLKGLPIISIGDKNNVSFGSQV